MPRAGLTPLRVLEEAQAVADEVGLANLTLATVALRLGVKLPSLYKHTAGMDALQRDLALLARSELAVILGSAVAGLEGEDAVVALAEEFRRWGHRYPGRYAATVRAADAGDAEQDRVSREVIGIISGTLHDFGLQGDAVIDALRALRSAMHGFISLEQAGGFALPVDLDRSYRLMVRGLARQLRDWPT